MSSIPCFQYYEDEIKIQPSKRHYKISCIHSKGYIIFLNRRKYYLHNALEFEILVIHFQTIKNSKT